MTEITDLAFISSLNALHEFAEAKSKLLAPRVLLKLEWQEGVPVLRTVTDEEMSGWDKFTHFFGFGGYQLKKIVAFLQSDAFRSKVETYPLESFQQRDIHAVAHSLDLKIKKYNDAAFHIFKIETEEKSLAKTVKKYLRSHEAPLATKKAMTVPSALIAEDLPPELASFEKELNHAVLQAHVVINQRGKIVGDARFQAKERAFESGIDRSRWHQIRNRAFILQELRKLHAYVAKADFLVLSAILSAQKKEIPSKQKFLELQEKALQELLEQDSKLNTLQTKDFSHFRSHLKSLKYDTIFEACGLTPVERTAWLTAADDIEKAHARLSSAKNAVRKMVLQDLQGQKMPPLAQELLDIWIDSQARKLSKRMWEPLINQSIENLAAKQMSYSEFHEHLVLHCSERKAAFELLDTLQKGKWGTLHAFYTKWKPFLHTEMIQGFLDSGEALGRGICWALSLRWAVEEVKNGSLSSIGTTRAEDRRLQALYHHEREAKPEKKMRASLGVTSSEKHYVDIEGLFGTGKLQDALKRIVSDTAFQNKFRGAAQLGFSWDDKGHAICIVCREDKEHPENSALRIHDPNFGTFQFPVLDGNFKKAKTLFLSCLTDLLGTYSPKFDALDYRCFEV